MSNEGQYSISIFSFHAHNSLTICQFDMLYFLNCLKHTNMPHRPSTCQWPFLAYARENVGALMLKVCVCVGEFSRW